MTLIKGSREHSWLPSIQKFSISLMLGEPNVFSIVYVSERRCRACDRSSTFTNTGNASTACAGRSAPTRWRQTTCTRTPGCRWSKTISRYDASREFEPWLTKICVNPIPERPAASSQKVPFLHVPHQRRKGVPARLRTCVRSRSDYRPLYEAIDRLPEKYRLAVILYYFDDRDIAATAQILGIPSGTVKSRLDRARKLLKEALGNETDL